jgi:hypothetical protein
MRMTQTAYRGIVQGGVVLLEQESPLIDGTEVLVTPVLEARRTGAVIVAALEKLPRVPSEWVDELERLIAEDASPAAPPELFGEALDKEAG